MWTLQKLVLIIGAVIIIAAAAYIGLVRPDLIGLGGEEAMQTEEGSIDDEQMAEDMPSNEPAFDIVRISEDATAVIAGRAVPGSKVTVKRGDEVIGTVTANDRGEWVLTLDQPLPPGAARLTLVAETPDGETYESSGAVVIAIPDGAGRALAVLMTPGEKSLVLQGVAPGDDRVLTVDTIDYDDKGNVIFAGRALPGQGVRVYPHDTLVGRAAPSEAGEGGLDPGGRDATDQCGDRRGQGERGG